MSENEKNGPVIGTIRINIMAGCGERVNSKNNIFTKSECEKFLNLPEVAIEFEVPDCPDHIDYDGIWGGIDVFTRDCFHPHYEMDMPTSAILTKKENNSYFFTAYSKIQKSFVLKEKERLETMPKWIGKLSKSFQKSTVWKVSINSIHYPWNGPFKIGKHLTCCHDGFAGIRFQVLNKKDKNGNPYFRFSQGKFKIPYPSPEKIHVSRTYTHYVRFCQENGIPTNSIINFNTLNRFLAY